jgi:type II restriction enzyme
LLGHDGLELYVARCGRFNVEAYAGLETIERAVSTGKSDTPVDLSHAGVQTLLAAVGNLKGYDVWVPAHDVRRLEWSLAKPFNLRHSIPRGYSAVESILSEIDVVWVAKSRDAIQALFEVEHTTTIYSGLLRFNDLLLSNPQLSRFSIVSNESRRAIFSRQLFRPTFQRSGLAEVTSFLEYSNVYDWHSRLSGVRRVS